MLKKNSIILTLNTYLVVLRKKKNPLKCKQYKPIPCKQLIIYVSHR